jgi:MFS family permease
MHSIWTNRALRALAGRGVTIYLFFGFISALYLLFALRDLHINAGLLGVIIATGGVGNMCGALLAEPVSVRFGMRRTFIASSLVIAASITLIPLAGGPVWRGAAFLMAGQLLGDFAMVVFVTNELSFRQKVTADERLGRVNAAMQILGRGMLPIGAMAGGILAGAIGTRSTMAIASAGIWLSSLWLLLLPREE